MYRPILALLACLALVGFTDAGGKFSIEFPAGWSDPVATDANGTMQSNDPKADGKIWCRANSVSLDSLKDVSQADLNRSYEKPLDHETWAGFYGIDAAQFSEAEPVARIEGGRIVQGATLSFAPALLGSDYKARVKAFFLPGHVVNGACFAPAEEYEQNVAVFEAALASLEPR